MNLDSKRICAEIDMKALEYNVSYIKSLLGDTKLMAVIKANAYGHGAVPVGRRLETLADYLAVACLSEAVELRQSGITAPILILGYTSPECARYLSENNLTQAVFDANYAQELSSSLCHDVKIHIKVNTGMNRLGVTSAQEVKAIAALKHMNAEGLFTHLADAASAGSRHVQEQINTFERIRDEAGINFMLTHCANSGGVLYYKNSHFDMARAGIALFGAEPFTEGRPVMQLTAGVVQVYTIKAGQAVGYGCDFCAQQDMTIAVVSAGYADGYMRSLSNRGVVAYNGKTVPVIGRVCMDMLMLDVSEIANPKSGDRVILFGGGGPSADEIARLAGTIAYELFTGITQRVPRIYE